MYGRTMPMYRDTDPRFFAPGGALSPLATGLIGAGLGYLGGEIFGQQPGYGYGPGYGAYNPGAGYGGYGQPGIPGGGYGYPGQAMGGFGNPGAGYGFPGYGPGPFR
ncbi:hypothetical protein SAMN05216389_11558 [Oceanobacillus limi]|uniref:Uncharacterized protein n=1 Tax=Oceanobacillus limi TaxID=930131 RepID=A0A1I0FHZ2_9BACI|nr:hypothetical protein [Oceanobacillus limi]SET57644.1 hypothetical protein SAMN05216389_11558 [Oceanobacillus limi]